MSSDPYATLGLAPGASAEAVKRAYRRLALRFHPDVARTSGAAARFREVAAAYELLKDPVRRAHLDAEREARAGAASYGGFRGSDGGPGSFRGERGWSDAAGAGADQQGWRGFAGDVREAVRDILEAFGLADLSFEDVLDRLPPGVRDALREQSAGVDAATLFDQDDDILRRPLRVLGGGEIEVDAVLSPGQAAAGLDLPFRFHLGPHLVDERLHIPAGTRTGRRHLYRMRIDDGLTLRVTVCVRVR